MPTIILRCASVRLRRRLYARGIAVHAQRCVRALSTISLRSNSADALCLSHQPCAHPDHDKESTARLPTFAEPKRSIPSGQHVVLSLPDLHRDGQLADALVLLQQCDRRQPKPRSP